MAEWLLNNVVAKLISKFGDGRFSCAHSEFLAGYLGLANPGLAQDDAVLWRPACCCLRLVNQDKQNVSGNRAAGSDVAFNIRYAGNYE